MTSRSRSPQAVQETTRTLLRVEESERRYTWRHRVVVLAPCRVKEPCELAWRHVDEHGIGPETAVEVHVEAQHPAGTTDRQYVIHDMEH